MTKFLISIVALSLFLPLNSANAIKILYDFSDPEQIKDWSLRNREPDKMALSDKFSSENSKSIYFYTPKYEKGMERWTGIQAKVDKMDISKYEKLVIELTNHSTAPFKLRFYVLDSKTNAQDSMILYDDVESLSYKQIVTNYKEGRPFLYYQKIDPQDVVEFRLFIKTPIEDIHLYVDRIYLLEKGEAVQPVDPALKAKGRELLKESKGYLDAKELLEKVTKWHEQETDNSKKQWLGSVIKETTQRLENVEKIITSQGEIDKETRMQLDTELTQLTFFKERIEQLTKLWSNYKKQSKNSAWQNVAVAVAPSTEKVLPKDVAFGDSVKITDKIDINMARNEYEAFQVVVLPFLDNLKDVQVDMTTLKNESGAIFPEKNIDTEIVGYVETYLPNQASFGQYVGWWPDPLLNFIDSTDIDKGISQSFFVRLRSPKHILSGTYKGKVMVSSPDISEPFEMDISVKVYDFQMPDRPALNVVMGFRPWELERLAKVAEKDYSEEKWDEKWKTLKFQWSDFLADYYMNYDSLYINSPDWPDFEVLEYLRDKGTLGYFNLGNVKKHRGPKDVKKWKELSDKALVNVRPAYEKAKELGIVDRAYVWGFDENNKEYFPLMEKMFGYIKEQLPKLKTFTCAGAYWDYWGQADNVDMWCPIIGSWNSKTAARERAEGNKVWWYVCLATTQPHPNVFIDEDAMNLRILMGAMSAKYQPYGFLYYAVNVFTRDREYNKNNDSYITSGPFTEWDPKAFCAANGDGFIVYPGPDATPLAAIRLENFRDGIEDYTYHKILSETVAKAKELESPTPRQLQWIKNCEQLLIIPENIVKDTRDYTRNPSILNNYRNKLANAIVSAPDIEPVKLK